MARETPGWLRALLRVAALRASEAEIGDIHEEVRVGSRTAMWAVRQSLSAARRGRATGAIREGRVEMLSNIARDGRYGLRTLARNPTFTLAAVAPIALGIGINTGLFSILNSLALRSLPTPASEDLVTVHQHFTGVKQRRVHGARSLFSRPEYETYRDRSRSLSGVMAYALPRTMALGGGAQQEVEAVLVTCNYFDVLQVRPALGRGLASGNCGSAPSVVITHRLWVRAFASDPSIVQRTIALNGRPVAVAGVAPEGFAGVDFTAADLFVPVDLHPLLFPERELLLDADTSWLTLVGRRRSDVDLGQVRAELALIARELDRQQPPRATTLTVERATALSLPPARRDILRGASIVLGAFGLVLLIACANVANLMLARASSRTREIAVRLSVGATRARLVQQLMTESLLIALAGGVAGTLLAWWSFQSLLAWLLSVLPGTIPALRVDAQVDGGVLWFAISLTAATAIAFGLVPALRASRPDVHSMVKRNGTQLTGGAGLLRSTLIGAQVAVCALLLITAVLLLRALHAAQTMDTGFEYRNVTTVRVDLRDPSLSDAALVAFRRHLVDGVSGISGVSAVSLAGKLPLTPGRQQNMLRLPDREQRHEVDTNAVSPSYFSVLGIPIVRGRTFTDAELGPEARVAIVTEATARRYWPDADPVGRTIRMATASNRDTPLEIVGVAKDVRLSVDGEVGSSYVYLPAGFRPQRRLELVVRHTGDTESVRRAIHEVIRQQDPTLVPRIAPLESNLDFWRTTSRLVASLSGTLSLLALVLSSLGVYGVVSWLVSGRRREVGIRMTLGASASRVQRMILVQTLRPVIVGAGLGIAGAAAAAKLLESVLFGISPRDPLAYASAAALLLSSAAIAASLPIRRALQMDPAVILREE